MMNNSKMVETELGLSKISGEFASQDQITKHGSLNQTMNSQRALPQSIVARADQSLNQTVTVGIEKTQAQRNVVDIEINDLGESNY